METRVVNRCAAFGTQTEVAGLHPLYGRRDFRHFVSSFVSQGIDDLAIFKFLGPLLGVGVVTTTHIRRNSIQPCSQITLLLLKSPAQFLIFVCPHCHSRYDLACRALHNLRAARPIAILVNSPIAA